mmetsp:Transcript_42157/g.80651  ORF Transcript_42157/g.80651 Transcript_42157/m.80651 type:complete len:86 (-) Transcript_42157:420-677(-)
MEGISCNGEVRFLQDQKKERMSLKWAPLEKREENSSNTATSTAKVATEKKRMGVWCILQASKFSASKFAAIQHNSSSRSQWSPTT